MFASNVHQTATGHKARMDLTELAFRVLIQQGIHANSDMWRHM